MVSWYFRRTCTTLSTYQHWFSSGSHSAASLSLFWWRLTLGDASVRFSRSDANSDLATSLAAHKPLSWASDLATIVLDVSFTDAVKPGPRVGPYIPPWMSTILGSTDGE